MAKNNKTHVPKKIQCEANLQVACNNQGVRLVTGPKRGDPKFNCCIGCRAYLNRQGVKVKDIEASEPTSKKRKRSSHG